MNPWPKLLYLEGNLVLLRIYDYGDYYMGMASSKEYSVWNCFGTTKEAAKEMALYRLKQLLLNGTKISNAIVDDDGYTYFHDLKN